MPRTIPLVRYNWRVLVSMSYAVYSHVSSSLEVGHTFKLLLREVAMSQDQQFG